MTRYTPATACAAATSMRLMRPCAIVLRKILPYSIPGRRRLCTYSAWPVTFSHDSRRGTERPTCGVSVAWIARFIHCPLHVDAEQLLLVLRGAVQVAFDREAFDRLRRRESCRLVGCGAHHDAGGAAVQDDGDAHCRPVVGGARRALEIRRAALAERRDVEARDQLVTLQSGLEIT